MLVFRDLWVLLGKGNTTNWIISGVWESHEVSVLSGLVALLGCHPKVTFLRVVVLPLCLNLSCFLDLELMWSFGKPVLVQTPQS